MCCLKYGLACARYLPPSKLKGVAIVNGLGPRDMGFIKETFDMVWWVSRGWILTEYFVSSQYVRPARSCDPKAMKIAWDKWKPPPKVPETTRQIEADRLEQWDAIRWRSIRGQFQTGAKGYIKEGKLYTGPWGFTLRDIVFHRVHIWHSTEDRLIPVEFAKAIAKSIPHAKFTEVPEEGHTSLVLNHGERILKELVDRE